MSLLLSSNWSSIQVDVASISQESSCTSYANRMAWKNSWAAVTLATWIGFAPYWLRAKSLSSRRYPE